MIFGPVPTLQAKGNILAHSIVCSGRRLRKGMELEDAHIEQLCASGIYFFFFKYLVNKK